MYVIRGAGYEIEDAILLHMNSDYVRQGDLDLQVLYTESSMRTEIEHLIGEVERSAASSVAYLEKGKIPERDIGPYCKDPVECDFIGHCWAHLPDPSIFNVYRLTTKKKFELYQVGITQIEDIPSTFQMSSSWSR